MEPFRVAPIATPDIGCSTLYPEPGNDRLIIHFLLFELIKPIAFAPLKESISTRRHNLRAKLTYVDRAYTVCLGNAKLQIEILFAAQSLEHLEAVLLRKLERDRLCVWAVRLIKFPQSRVISLHIVDKHLNKVLNGVGEIKCALCGFSVCIGVSVQAFHKLIHHTVKGSLIGVMSFREHFPGCFSSQGVLLTENQDLIPLFQVNKISGNKGELYIIITHKGGVLHRRFHGTKRLPGL